MKKSGKKFGSDFAKVDAHRIRATEYEEIPELTEEMLARGVHKRDGKRMGRPPKADKKVSVHLRLDPDICAAYRAMGKGWQSHMNAVLRDHRPTV